MPTDIELKKQIQQELSDEEQARRDAMLKENMLLRAGAKSDKSAREAAIADREWDKLLKDAKAMTQEGIKGFDSWISATCSILVLCYQIEKAIKASDPIGELLGIPFGIAIEAIKSKMDAIKLAKLPDVALPTLHTHIEFSDDNKLILDSFVKNLSRSDGKPFTNSQKALLEGQYKTAVLVQWLDKQGYRAKDPTNPSTIVSKIDGTELTKPEFERLRDNSFNQFMSEHIGMHVEDAPGPRPAR